MTNFVITNEWMRANGTSGIGFTSKQLAILGVKAKNNKGWLRRLIGTRITLEQKAAFEKAFQNRQRRLLRNALSTDAGSSW
jgi:hypothetical protein